MNRVYLDFNATTPVDARVADVVMRMMVEEFGNAGSRTHEFGARAKRAVQNARAQVAALVAAQLEEVYFTSGATESNNLAILGLAPSAVEFDCARARRTSASCSRIVRSLSANRCGAFASVA